MKVFRNFAPCSLYGLCRKKQNGVFSGLKAPFFRSPMKIFAVFLCRYKEKYYLCNILNIKVQ